MNQFAEAVWLGHKVSIEDRKQLALSQFQSSLESSSLEAGAIQSVYVLNIEALFDLLLHCCFGKFYGFIC